jgi:hypothetical protein
MASSKYQSKGIEAYFLSSAVGLLLLSFVALNSGSVIFLAPMLVPLAPDMLLLGLTLGATFIANIFVRRRLPLFAFFLFACIIVGANTRIPTILHDLIYVKWREEQLPNRQVVSVGHAVRLVYDGKILAARQFPYAAALPHCRGDGCFMTDGFRTPLPHIQAEYWLEDPEETLRSAGLSLAEPEERAPTLTVSTARDGYILAVDLRMSDADGNTISSAKYRYRNGFPSEPEDDSNSVENSYVPRGLEKNFFLHANVVNAVLGSLAAPTLSYPVKNFLIYNFDIKSVPELSGVVHPIRLETIANEVNSPVLIYDTENHGIARARRPETTRDDKRSRYCDTLFQRDSLKEHGGTAQVWWKFIQDPKSRIKIHRSAGTELCDENGVWSFDYGSASPRVLVTKYKPTGELQYQASYEKPSTSDGYGFQLMEKSLHERDGYLYFDMREEKHTGQTLTIKRTLTVRFPLPRPAGIGL